MSININSKRFGKETYLCRNNADLFCPPIGKNFALNRSKIRTQNRNKQIIAFIKDKLTRRMLKTRACADVFPRCCRPVVRKYLHMRSLHKTLVYKSCECTRNCHEHGGRLSAFYRFFAKISLCVLLLCA